MGQLVPGVHGALIMNHILFPVDFSDPCRAVAGAVAVTARALGARISLLHFVRLPHLQSEFAARQGHFQTVMEELAGGLRDYQRDLWTGLQVESRLKTGEPAHEIVTSAGQEAVDLVMMPKRGRTRFRPLLIGSVTASVLHDAHCAVWTSAHAEEWEQPTPPCRSILCAVDLGDAAVPVLRTAGEMAARFNAVLRVVHVAAGGSSPAPTRPRCEALVAGAGLGEDVIIDVVNQADIVQGVFLAGKVQRADLLVIGRGHLQSTLGRLRTNAHNLILLSPCPVLSV